jgi:hypothetical protein
MNYVLIMVTITLIQLKETWTWRSIDVLAYTKTAGVALH